MARIDNGTHVISRKHLIGSISEEGEIESILCDDDKLNIIPIAEKSNQEL